MADEDLEEGGKKKGKLLIIIIVAVVLLLGGGAAAYFFLFAGGDDTEEQAQEDAAQEEVVETVEQPLNDVSAEARYVAMPRPFIFNAPGIGKDRLVQIEVQLLVRGSMRSAMAQSHIPLIEARLLEIFSASSADELVTDIGKVALRQRALDAVNEKMIEVAQEPIVEELLFTGFVMQ